MPPEIYVDGVRYVPESHTTEVTAADMRRALFRLWWGKGEFSDQDMERLLPNMRVFISFDPRYYRDPTVDDLVDLMFGDRNPE